MVKIATKSILITGYNTIKCGKVYVGEEQIRRGHEHKSLSEYQI